MTENASEETPTAVSSVVCDGTVINDEVNNIQDVNDDDNTINAACEFDIIEEEPDFNAADDDDNYQPETDHDTDTGTETETDTDTEGIASVKCPW